MHGAMVFLIRSNLSMLGIKPRAKAVGSAANLLNARLYAPQHATLQNTLRPKLIASPVAGYRQRYAVTACCTSV
jgi:hypothetical protein